MGFELLSDIEKNVRLADKRYGSLSKRSKQCWHNFADPELRGDASPNNEPVWRVLDRNRVSSFLGVPHSTKRKLTSFENDADFTDGGLCSDKGDEKEVMAVIEISGDDFLKQQVPRIIASVVAICNGWLPEDYFNLATRPDIFLQTPLAPIHGHMYFAGSKFHFDKLENRGMGLFDGMCRGENGENKPTETIKTWVREMQNILLQERISNEIRRLDKEWLCSLHHDITPRISKAIKNINQITSQGTNEYKQTSQSDYENPCSTENEEEVPCAYLESLQLLRKVSKKWPVTSAARSKVIRNNDVAQNINQIKEKGVLDLPIELSGSFTVINPKFSWKTKILPTHANTLFPELVEAVFDLERRLSIDIASTSNKIQQRPVSSHCAINRNAQFTPHVDSGRGAGQSLSMIVGLGNYTGGELFIEGEPSNIRYIPIEFNGWKMRHWTAPFHGERFSLVWFTPEEKGNKSNRN